MNKKIFINSLAALLIICLFSCNGDQETSKANEKPKPDSPGEIKRGKQVAEFIIDCSSIANLAVPEDTATDMRARYRQLYKKKGTPDEVANLADSVWIDAMVIGSFADFLEKEQSVYNGGRFMNTAATSNNESSLHLVPTKRNAANAKAHLNDWGPGKFGMRDGSQIRFQNFNTSLGTATTVMGNFERKYRTKQGVPPDQNPLSAGVWISNCVFLSLRSIIDDPSNQIDGVRIYFGAYSHMMTPKIDGQFDPNQSTIILVPTSSDGAGGHNDRWDIIKARSNPAKWGKDAGYNHGALCPNQCE